MKRNKLAIILFFSFLSFGVYAVTFNQNKIGPVVFHTVGGLPLASQALSAFRSVASPVGAALTAYQVVKFIASTDTFQNAFNVVPGTNPDNAGIANSYYPSDWSGPNSPPLTTPVVEAVYYQGEYTTNKYSAEQVCNANFLKAYGPSFFDSHKLVSASYEPRPNGQCIVYQINQNLTFPFGNVFTKRICPAGYQQSGEICNLISSDLVKWPSDNTATFKPDSSGNWQLDSRDPDISTITPSGDTITRSGSDEFGNPIKETFRTTPDKGSDYIRESETVNQSTGLPEVHRDSLHFDEKGAIVSNSSTVINNSTINNSSSSIGSGSSLPNITVSGSTSNPSLFSLTAPTFSESSKRFIDGLKSKPFYISFNKITQLTDNSSECPLIFNFTIPLFFTSIPIYTTIVCDLLNQLSPVISAICLLIYAWVAVELFMTA